VLPSLSPYRVNKVVLDSSSVSPDVQFVATAQDIVPRAGAIVPVSFEASRERSWVLRALLTQGQPLPLGAQILDAEGAVLGVVDHSGYALIRGEPAAGMLSARWGQRASERCDLADGRPGATSRMATMEHAETRCTDNVEES
jgi:outer membrane usher protein